jgi:GrpB-like predicted nucleotidyltransferase (UPF0157 family)
MIDIDEHVQVVEADPSWAKAFATERARLVPSLQQYDGRFEHIGSTAVPGLIAKPTIDMMLGVTEYPPSAELLSVLTGLGYELLGEAGVPGRIYLRLRGSRDYNLHVVQHAGDHWRRNIQFRDYLSQSKPARDRYAAAKRQAIDAGATRLLTYSSAKESIISELIREAAMRSNKLLERTPVTERHRP